VSSGFYVDVGANSPTGMSVTKAFYLRGWHGINIEPLDYHYRALVRDRPRDLNLNFGCGANYSKLTLHEGDGMSTVAKEEVAKWRHQHPTRIIEVYPLTQILQNYSVKEIHFCKIDVEGFEKDVLLGLNFSLFRPWVFCIESAFPGTNTPSQHIWEHILVAHEYRFGCQYSFNRFYYDAQFHPEMSTGLVCENGFRYYDVIDAR
jgi:FkbM family methyltransferase